MTLSPHPHLHKWMLCSTRWSIPTWSQRSGVAQTKTVTEFIPAWSRPTLDFCWYLELDVMFWLKLMNVWVFWSQ